jgi:predicted ATP-dependent endonuclease of OLD family
MRLKEFRVTKFRNIVDSGPIKVDAQVTCLVGKNEAGKSGLIEALELLNPAYGQMPSRADQYPRWLVAQDRRKGDLDEQVFITATFELDENDHAAVDSVLGAGVLVGNELVIERQYNGIHAWDFDYSEKQGLANIVASFPSPVAERCARVSNLVEVRATLSDLKNANADEAVGADAIEAARKVLVDRGIDKISIWDRLVACLEKHLPRFFRFTSYSTLPGRIDFREISNQSPVGPGQSGLQTARALMKLAGADFDQLGNDNYEVRKAELEAVQIDLTRQVFEYWTQNPNLRVHIDVDKETQVDGNSRQAVARFLDIRLEDSRTGYSNNFQQRSSGFQWFFSFLAAFSEFSGQSSPIVLLDEPALTLHGKAQADFLRFINERLAPTAPVIYTTHSPFMIEADRLERVRVVEDKGPPEGAVVNEDALASDPDSLFPLQAALGYDIAQSLFVGPHNLVVEGTSDYIYLTILSRLCVEAGLEGLDKRWRILPAGGATNIPTFVSLVGPHLDITVLADSDTKGMQRVANMIERKLLEGHRLVHAHVATGQDKADIEDLFSESDYLDLYNRTFGEKVQVGDLPSGDRIVKRIEALRGSEFIHGEVAETLLRHHHEISISEATLAQFAALNFALNSTMAEG